jgi:predicted nucleic acid-binding protein
MLGVEPCLKKPTKTMLFCAAHTIAEVYSAITRLPVQPPITPAYALRCIQEIRQKFTVVPLSEDDYFDCAARLADLGLAKNFIYDALIVLAAVKCDAAEIYTWNTSHFLRVAPAGVVDRIRTP